MRTEKSKYISVSVLLYNSISVSVPVSVQILVSVHLSEIPRKKWEGPQAWMKGRLRRREEVQVYICTGGKLRTKRSEGVQSTYHSEPSLKRWVHCVIITRIFGTWRAIGPAHRVTEAERNRAGMGLGSPIGPWQELFNRVHWGRRS